jgi:hypothetical protein
MRVEWCLKCTPHIADVIQHSAVCLLSQLSLRFLARDEDSFMNSRFLRQQGIELLGCQVASGNVPLGVDQPQ